MCFGKLVRLDGGVPLFLPPARIQGGGGRACKGSKRRETEGPYLLLRALSIRSPQNRRSRCAARSLIALRSARAATEDGSREKSEGAFLALRLLRDLVCAYPCLRPAASFSRSCSLSLTPAPFLLQLGHCTSS